MLWVVGTWIFPRDIQLNNLTHILISIGGDVPLMVIQPKYKFPTFAHLKNALVLVVLRTIFQVLNSLPVCTTW